MRSGRYEQLEKLLMRAADDDGFAEELRQAGPAAAVRYVLDQEEAELLALLSRDDGMALEALLRVARAASANAALRAIEAGS